MQIYIFFDNAFFRKTNYHLILKKYIGKGYIFEEFMYLYFLEIESYLFFETDKFLGNNLTCREFQKFIFIKFIAEISNSKINLQKFILLSKNIFFENKFFENDARQFTH